MVRATLLCIMLLKASVGHAAECSPPQYIEAGTTALCSGWVHSHTAATNCLRWKLDLKGCTEEAAKSIELLTEKLSVAKLLLQEERDAHAETLTLLDTQKAIIIPQTPLYAKPLFVSLVVFVITCAIVIPVTWMATREALQLP